MTINEELREKAIEEYLKEKNELTRRTINHSMKMAVLIMGLIYMIVFEALALRDFLARRPEDGLELFGMGIMVTAIFLLPSSLFVWLVLKRRAARDSTAAEEELRKVSCAIENDSLVRRIAGDGRRTKRYKLENIGDVSKKGYVVTFDYGNTDVELLDYYEPSLFDSLQGYKGKQL